MKRLMRQYADDCIHLKACRRMCKIAQIYNRHCNAETCTAYESADKRRDDLIDRICESCETPAETRLRLCENCPIISPVREAFNDQN